MNDTDFGSECLIQSYKQYRNAKFTKHHDMLKNQLRQINDYSLKPEDKIKLIKELYELLITKL